jgi:HSP20 family protein
MRLRTIEPWTLATAWRRSPLPMRLHSVPAGKGVHTVGKPHADAVDWLPAVDIVEQDDHFVLRADLPGVAPEHIEIDSNDGLLSLRGEKRGETSAIEGGVQRRERHSGKFLRRFRLPDSVDTDAISAQSRNGTLEVTIPKHKNLSRRIEVNAA